MYIVYVPSHNNPFEGTAESLVGQQEGEARTHDGACVCWVLPFYLLLFLLLLRWSTVLDVADTDATGSVRECDVAHDRSSEAVDVVVGLVECISLIGTDLVGLLVVGTFGEMSVSGSLDDVGRERIVSGRSGDDDEFDHVLYTGSTFGFETAPVARFNVNVLVRVVAATFTSSKSALLRSVTPTPSIEKDT